MEDKPKNARDNFHSHLDVCRQCEKNPFNLCEIGRKLLEQTANREQTTICEPKT